MDREKGQNASICVTGADAGPVTAYIALGANIGERERSLHAALTELDRHNYIKVAACSDIYETDPVGYEDQPEFLNMTACLATSLDAEALLQVMLDIEKRLGRVRNIRNGPRVIDLDLLWVEGSKVNTPDLTLPHPRMGERLFVMVPLADIVPESDTQLHAFVHQALGTLDGKEGIRKWKRSSWPSESAPSASSGD
ncbi:2-amino-4-hydroxy-6-hydroxymethyldihydropteridine diphosphokinase [Paenibacillus apiarius]|uniref:2-amino-4-hydroxy-6- hydroxymethyldihydropteridine diphosphokinase n=1 Tax=Paenibacillus apiarius TaxID=46240 RepID=UPI001981272D|nr:2-amino-4-hydroxy-6-hydroxymethyldihydropteridine diphosphokinase [Paenibacillus apiarius]MBN3524373.1 2-amino-4-hydroxy-6-hydroxymethyldihydropteridine diphosphokinase [Paenibacillus apiarius]